MNPFLPPPISKRGNYFLCHHKWRKRIKITQRTFRNSHLPPKHMCSSSYIFERTFYFIFLFQKLLLFCTCTFFPENMKNSTALRYQKWWIMVPKGFFLLLSTGSKTARTCTCTQTPLLAYQSEGSTCPSSCPCTPTSISSYWTHYVPAAAGVTALDSQYNYYKSPCSMKSFLNPV